MCTRSASGHSRVPKNYLQLDEAQIVVAQDAGFGSWDALMQAVAAGAPPEGEAYVIDTKENRIGPRRRMTGYRLGRPDRCPQGAPDSRARRERADDR